MPYVPNPNDPTEPLGSRPAGTAAEEFRALKAVVLALAVVAAGGGGPRQVVQSAVLDANGYNNAITTGSGLRPGLTASSTDPYHLSFANGFSAGKAVNNEESIVANNSDILGADLPTSNTSFLYRNYGVGYESGLIPPQYGYAFDRTQSALLNFEGADGTTAMLDDFGNAWTASGNAQIDTAQFKFGASSLLLDGTGDYTESTNFTTLGDGSWEISGWHRANATSGLHVIFAAENATGFGVVLYFNHNAANRVHGLLVSSNGTSNDIVSTSGAATGLSLNTWYGYRVVFDALAGTYRLYLSVNGAAESQDITASSTARVCAITKMRLGRSAQAGTTDYNGWIDAFRFIRAATATATQTPSASAPTITNHKVNFFSIPKMQMFEVSAASVAANTNPTLAPVVRLALGEADTSGAAVTAVRNYAIRGEFEARDTGVPSTTRISKNHLIGMKPRFQRVAAVCVSPTPDGYTVGDEIPWEQWHNNASAVHATVIQISVDRSSIGIIATASTLRLFNKNTGADSGFTASQWNTKFNASRGW